MRQDHDAAREISYASSARSKGGRAMVRLLENATGRMSLIRRAAGYQSEIAEGRDFWQVMVDRYGLSLNIVAGQLDLIPRNGPLIVIANHPFGILDGLILGHILSAVRGDFRIMAHRVFRRAEDLNRVILPISFDETKAAVQQNIDTRQEALRYLANGGAIGIFPGGTVSTAPKPFGRPADPKWRTFTAKMIAKSGATVVPIYFDGANSRLFQLASHMHATLRVALLIKEFRARIDSPVGLSIGAPLSPESLASFAGDAKGMMDFLRAQTYALSGTTQGGALGYEFEAKYKG